MSLNNFRLENKLEIDYRIKKSEYYLLYVLKNNEMLKKYILNDEYKKMLESRDTDFLEYLRMLMDYQKDFILRPKDIYVRHSYVTAYTYHKISGTSLMDMYPKTSVDKLLDALKEFYEQLNLFEEFNFEKLEPSDILYTGKIVIGNLEKSEFEAKDDTRKVLDNLLLRGIFKVTNDEIGVSDDFVKSLYGDFAMGNLDIIDFMNEYIRFVRSEYGNCKYVKHLDLKIIK